MVSSDSSGPLPGLPRCQIHHGDPAAVCPPELGDALDTLRVLDINPRLVTEHAFLLDVCGACPDDPDTLPQTAVVRINFTGATSGRRWHEDACLLHIAHVVRWWRRHGHTVTADLPVPAHSWGSIVSGVTS